MAHHLFGGWAPWRSGALGWPRDDDLGSSESELPCTRPVPIDTPRLPELPFKRWKYRRGAARFVASAHRYDMRSTLISIC
jgi:hypothetical protein